MSDSNKNPGPPPDDFSKTTPNVNLPDEGGKTDWDKTNYNFPRQPAADDWGKTVTNIKPINTEQQDFGKTMYPGAQNVPSADWGMTQANVDVRNDTDFGPAPEEFSANDKTTPYFSLPETERQKYQNLPPTPAEQAAQKQREKDENRGIPGWIWAIGGLMLMFSFSVIVLFFVYFFVLRDTSFEASVKGAPPGSDILVDNQYWGVTDEDGTYRAQNLKAGRKVIKIMHPNYVCEPREVTGGDGAVLEPIIARCQPVAAKADDDCANIRLGEEDKAERCYYGALEALPDPFTPEALVRALNILVINFDSSKFNVPSKRLAALQKGAGYIRRLPTDIVLEVGGHTDNVGGDTSNQSLSENRANAVKQTLVKYGARDETLRTRGYGADKPKPEADNSTEQGRFHNRRIEYSIVK